MQKMILSGCNGHMGRAVADLCSGQPDIEIVAGFDILGQPNDNFPVFPSPVQCGMQADVVIDFSNPAALTPLLEFSLARGIPLVLATTGYDLDQLDLIQEAAQKVPIFRSANMSLGINVLLTLVKQAAAALGEDFDVEIVERHHSRKLDAPNGTALMLADAASSALPYDPEYIYDRHLTRKARDRREIGISSVRGGTIVGDHTITFAGTDEIIEIKHHAASRSIFAAGAIKAARFLMQVKQPGLYDMSDLLKAKGVDR